MIIKNSGFLVRVFLIKANFRLIHLITDIILKRKNFLQCIRDAIVVKNLKPPIGGFFVRKF